MQLDDYAPPYPRRPNVTKSASGVFDMDDPFKKGSPCVLSKAMESKISGLAIMFFLTSDAKSEVAFKLTFRDAFTVEGTSRSKTYSSCLIYLSR